MTVQIAVRLPEEIVEELDRLVPDAHRSRSEGVRRALELYLARLAAEGDAEIYGRRPLTDDELSLSDDAGNWEATPSW